MLWTVLVAAAAGGTAPEEVRDVVLRHPQVSAVLSCAPLRSMAGFVRTVPLPAAVAAGAVPRLLLDLSEDGAAASAGIDPAGAFTLVHHGGGAQSVRLPFSGTEEQARTLLAELGATTDTAEGTELTVGERKFVASLTGGVLVLETPGRSRERGSSGGEPLLDGLPEVPGCVAHVVAPKLPQPKGRRLPGPPVEVSSATLFFPLEGGAPAVWRIRTSEPLPDAFSRTDAPIPVGNATDTPTAVVTMSAPSEAVLAGFAAQAEGGTAAGFLDEFHRYLRMPEGAAVAFYGNPQRGGDWVGMVRVLDASGEPLPTKKLVKLVVKTTREFGARKLGPDAFGFAVGTRLVFARVADDGRVVFASDPALAGAAFAPTGLPWLDDAALARARTAPVLLTSPDPKLDLEVALREHRGAIELTIDWRMTPAEREKLEQGLAPMLGMVVPLVLTALQDSN